MMTIRSINEPDGPGRTTMLTPNSINEPETVDPPVISSITPDNCTVGQPDFMLVVDGSGFYPASVIVFAGHDEPTTLHEDGTLTTGVKPSLWLNPVTVQCQVRNGPLISNAVDFVFSPEDNPQSAFSTDPDELDDEIDQAVEDGDVTVPRRRKR